MYEWLFKISDTVGIVGVTCVLSAYLFINLGRWKSTDSTYQWLNFTGAWLILFSLYFHWNLSSVVIEVAWLLISATGIIRGFILKKVRL